MKVALVHDWLTGMRGGERCLQSFLSLYPTADIFTLVHIKGATSVEIDTRVKQASFLSSMPFPSKIYRYLLPLYPTAIRTLDLTGYDLIISLSHAAAKNIHVPKGAVHLCYCFTPMRYIWDQSWEYFGAVTPVFAPILYALRMWDRAGSKTVTEFAAISSFIKARIRCFYKRTAQVICPPVNTDWIKPIQDWKQGEAFLYAGALVPYKRPDVVVEAFNQIGLPLWVVGTGPLEKSLKAKAKKNVTFLGGVNDIELAKLYTKSRALIFPGIEDFGMIPVECMAAGRPVIGIYKGGIKETVTGLKHWEKIDSGGVSDSSGVFIRPDGVNPINSLISSVRYFMTVEENISPQSCTSQASKFSPEVFKRSWNAFSAKYI